MKQNNILVTTLPIKPQEKTSIGMSIAPFLADLISKNLNCSSVFSINLLHSYEDKEKCLNTYLNDISNLEIYHDDIFIDKNYSEFLLNMVKKLIELGKIIEVEDTVLRCECGKVEILKTGLRDFDNQGDLYYINNNDVICKKCNKVCNEYVESGLYFHFDDDVQDSLQIFPPFLKKATEHFSKNFKGNNYLISKKRNTNYSLVYNDKTYNIDIDFLWLNYVNCFSPDNQIIIASNHQLFEMYLLNYINNMLYKKKLYFIATPYLRNPQNLDLDQFFESATPIYEKLCVLYTLKWKTNDSNWDISILKGLKKLSLEQQEALYSYIESTEYSIDENNQNNLLGYINSLMTDKINYQRNLKRVKKK